MHSLPSVTFSWSSQCFFIKRLLSLLKLHWPSRITVGHPLLFFISLLSLLLRWPRPESPWPHKFVLCMTVSYKFIFIEIYICITYQGGVA
ncbi:hypothetical protein BDB00DRAFT_849915 [Zychaea mexicana]|uniref:uncharacterized protein n=1 Tax=Zychaea mexicana TaxID=64656 RepID=UPI0022FE7845|nr:uncharacterized protein BDB00DRAFT_849915 [Zychaea mexicana]KAI9488086.1 hypothetical protein BDB00DRAFT_849915 [Zychaea mexicana]